MSITRRLRPFNGKDEMIVTVAVEVLDRPGSILFLVIVDERKSLALVGVLVLCQKDSGDASERFEQILQISFLSVFGEVGDPDGRGVFGCK